MEISKAQKSVYIAANLWERAKQKAGEAGLSYVIARLLQMWLDGEITIIVEAREA